MAGQLMQKNEVPRDQPHFEELTVAVGVTASHAVAAPDYDSFAWQVLTTLATHAASDNRDGLYTVRLTMVPGHLEAGL